MKKIRHDIMDVFSNELNFETNRFLMILNPFGSPKFLRTSSTHSFSSKTVVAIIHRLLLKTENLQLNRWNTARV